MIAVDWTRPIGLALREARLPASGMPQASADGDGSTGSDAGPPSNVWRTLDRSLVASANGPPGWPLDSVTSSSTKYWPDGVGVDGFPTTAGK